MVNKHERICLFIISAAFISKDFMNLYSRVSFNCIFLSVIFFYLKPDPRLGVSIGGHAWVTRRSQDQG